MHAYIARIVRLFIMKYLENLAQASKLPEEKKEFRKKKLNFMKLFYQKENCSYLKAQTNLH